MKTILFILTLTLSIGAVTSCKSQKDAAAIVGATTGKVSHQYQSTGCSTVVIIAGTNGPVTIIPKDKLSAEFDVDGLEITFDYRALKMPQPKRCNVGMPAELTNIAKSGGKKMRIPF